MKLVFDWFAVPPGEIYPRTLPAGSQCPDGLEDLAIAAGVAEAPRNARASRKPRDAGTAEG